MTGELVLTTSSQSHISQCGVGANANHWVSGIQHDLPSKLCYFFKCKSLGHPHALSHTNSSQIYRDDDKPYYRRGNKVLLGIVAWNVVMTIFIKVYYIRRNRSRALIWDAMSSEERDQYLKTTKDEGNKRLDFRFAH